MFDLAKFDILAPSEEGKWFYPKHPGTGRPIGPSSEDGNLIKPFGFLMYGRHSRVVRDAQRQMQDAYAVKQDAGQVLSEAESEMILAEYLARCTKGWTEGLVIDGREWPFTYEHARSLWADGRFRWMHPQAREFINSDGVFIAA